MEQIGKFLKKSEIKTFPSGFQMAEFYLDCQKFNSFTGEPIPNILKFKISGDKLSQIENLTKGEEIKVLFNIRGNFYDKTDGSGKAFGQSLEVWKIENISKTEPTQAKPIEANQPTMANDQNPFADEEDNDMPF